MNERKQLKKKLAKLKHYKANLPRLIDCSNVYGDDYYSKDDLSDVDKQIEEVEKQIADFGTQNIHLKTKIDMENKTSTNHENGNDANRLLAAGLRVKLHLADVNSNSFVIPNFHFVPRKDDLIDVENLIDEKNYSGEELDKIYSLSWSVWYVNWGKDEFGFFAEIVCEGE